MQISKPVHEVFSYTITPPNTKFWVDSIVDEKTGEWPVRVGSTYFEKMKGGEWLGYYVSALKENELFELISDNGNYHVRYTYKPLGDNACELEYYEWVDRGDLEDPFNTVILDKLKEVLEN